MLGKTRTLTVLRLISCWTALSIGLDVRILIRCSPGQPEDRAHEPTSAGSCAGAGWSFPHRRGRAPHRVGHNLLFRLRDRRADVLRFLYDPTVPFTNNLAEQDGRMMKVKQKISGGFRSDEGAEDFGIIRTMLSTARKQGWNLLQALIGNPETLIAKLRFA